MARTPGEQLAIDMWGAHRDFVHGTLGLSEEHYKAYRETSDMARRVIENGGPIAVSRVVDVDNRPGSSLTAAEQTANYDAHLSERYEDPSNSLPVNDPIAMSEYRQAAKRVHRKPH